MDIRGYFTFGLVTDSRGSGEEKIMCTMFKQYPVIENRTTIKIREKHPRLILICFCILLMFCLGACGKTVSKSKLLTYAKKTYGKCKLISEEHSGSGSDEVRTLYLQDIDTGMEYYVTSKLQEFNVDGSVFGYTENKSSDFDEKYNDYVIDSAEQELSELNTGHPVQLILGKHANKIIFDKRISDEDSKAISKKIAEIIADHDKKDYLLLEFLVYSENEEIYIGYYDYSGDTFSSSQSYKVIDYVYDNIDKDAEFRFYIGGSLASYLSYEDLNEVDLDKQHLNGMFYFFISSTGVEFVAFDMEDYGMSGIYCVTRESRERFILSSD